MSLVAFLTAWALCLGAAISPGPAVLMSARIGLQYGVRSGAALAAGIGLGAVSWALAALFGLSLLFEFAPVLLSTLKVFGAAYLIYLAIKIWRSATDPIDSGAARAVSAHPLALFRMGLLTQFANPKPAVFFGAVFVGTVPESAPMWTLALLLFCIFLGEFFWNLLVARIFALETTRRGYLGSKHLIDRIFGGMLAALGIKIVAL